ncbi:hypothetical protein OQJ13_03255 [Legionella sp. PATHC035]|uniref:hypothetical protein n=1 Tax=Legionella sp. PATHC035 TaxID=2992040 RepID=UPI00224342F9|nr:hypothetical protein [Legionella sp. PATHC035]MCW8407987.1 hypothetical protein [Legionella sp. PATHC035]
MKMKRHEWMNEDGELNLVTGTQKKLAQSPQSQALVSQYLFFKQHDLTGAQQIRKNVNHAMEIAYERDVGFGPNEHVDLPHNNFGY